MKDGRKGKNTSKPNRLAFYREKAELERDRDRKEEDEKQYRTRK